MHPAPTAAPEGEPCVEGLRGRGDDVELNPSQPYRRPIVGVTPTAPLTEGLEGAAPRDLDPHWAPVMTTSLTMSIVTTRSCRVHSGSAILSLTVKEGLGGRGAGDADATVLCQVGVTVVTRDSLQPGRDRDWKSRQSRRFLHHLGGGAFGCGDGKEMFFRSVTHRSHNCQVVLGWVDDAPEKKSQPRPVLDLLLV